MGHTPGGLDRQLVARQRQRHQVHRRVAHPRHLPGGVQVLHPAPRAGQFFPRAEVEPPHRQHVRGEVHADDPRRGKGLRQLNS